MNETMRQIIGTFQKRLFKVSHITLLLPSRSRNTRKRFNSVNIDIGRNNQLTLEMNEVNNECEHHQSKKKILTFLTS